LQDDFSMDQTLSLYLIETLPLLDPQAPDYALDLLTLVESILEDPDLILRRQLDKIKGQAVAEMKLQGLDYDQRMAELEKLEYPKPRRDFIYSTFNAFADKHPWVGQENIRPKSIAREMFETFRSFADYVRDYELQRAEGLLLRHLNSTYKVLAQTVPDAAKTDAVREMELYLGTMLRQVDSSLLDEWEKMRDPDYERRVAAERGKDAGLGLRPPGAEAAAADVTRDTWAVTAAIRNRIFTLLRCLAVEDFETALATLAEFAGETVALPPDPTADTRGPTDLEGNAWTAARLAERVEAYRSEHRRICLDPEARNVRHTYVVPADDRRTWRVQQMLIDPDGHNDWAVELELDLAESRQLGKPALRLVRIGPLIVR
jgi:hypothetical protein